MKVGEVYDEFFWREITRLTGFEENTRRESARIYIYTYIYIAYKIAIKLSLRLE